MELSGLGAGVIFLIDFPQMLAADMRIYLSGGDLAVSEHELNRPKIGPPLQQVGGKRVPENMRAYLIFQTRLPSIPFQHFPKSLSGKRPTPR